MATLWVAVSATAGDVLGSTIVATAVDTDSFTPGVCKTFSKSSVECHPIPIAPPISRVDTPSEPIVSYLPATQKRFNDFETQDALQTTNSNITIAVRV